MKTRQNFSPLNDSTIKKFNISKILQKLRKGFEIGFNKVRDILNPNIRDVTLDHIPFLEDNVFDPIAREKDILYCFRLILGRFPSRNEWKGHSSFIGRDLEKVVSSYINSLEFSNRKLLLPTLGDIQLIKLEKFSMYLSPSDYDVGLPILTSKTYEPNVTRILDERIKSGMTALDVGANIGYFSMLMSSLVGEKGKCIAIEPNMRNVRLLLASKKMNRFEQLQIFQAAAGSSWDILHLNTAFSNGVVSPVNANIEELFNRETVMCLRIDDILPQDLRVDIIKIDVEGAEFSALSGAIRCIEKYHPIIISEFMPGGLPNVSGITPEEYLNFFISRGYHLSVLEPDHTISCQKDIVKVMKIFHEKSVDHIDILAEPHA